MPQAKLETQVLKRIIKLAGCSTKTKSLLDPIKMVFKSNEVNVAVSDEAKTLACILNAKGVAEVDEEFEVVVSPKVILRVLDDYLKFSNYVTLKVSDDKLVLDSGDSRYSEPLMVADIYDVSNMINPDFYMAPKINADVAGVYAFSIEELKNLGTEDYVNFLVSDRLVVEIPVGSGVVTKTIPSNVIRKHQGSPIKYVLSKPVLKLIVSVLSGSTYFVFMHKDNSPAPVIIYQEKEKVKVAYWIVPLET